MCAHVVVDSVVLCVGVMLFVDGVFVFIDVCDCVDSECVIVVMVYV